LLHLREDGSGRFLVSCGHRASRNGPDLTGGRRAVHIGLLHGLAHPVDVLTPATATLTPNN
jgi:hypothetical protein